jgi:hypothetical protein
MGEPCAAVLVEEPPEFEFRNGLFYVCCPLTGVCRAYRPHTFFKTIAKMVEVGRSYRMASAEVVPLFAEHQAASASGSPSK